MACIYIINYKSMFSYGRKGNLVEVNAIIFNFYHIPRPYRSVRIITSCWVFRLPKHFDKSQHEHYAKLSTFHAQLRLVGNRSAFGRFACKEL